MKLRKDLLHLTKFQSSLQNVENRTILVKEIISTMMATQKDVTPSIPLSNSTASSRIDEMANDIENKLCDELKTTQFSLQLDETTLRDNEALIMAYVRYVNASRKVIEEFLFAEQLEVDTKGSTVYKAVEQFFKRKGIPLLNAIACATDGAPSMIGRHRGFIAHLKREVPDLFTIHCVIHRQYLVAKHLSDRLHCTLQAVIRAVNKIKAHSLNDRIFRQLCHENEEEFERLLLHTEVRWLSKGKCLQRFYNLYNSVIDFFKFNLLDEKVSLDLESRRADVAYLSDIFKKLNEVNMKLQGTNMCLIKAKGIITTFIGKLDFYKNCLLRLGLNQFPSLKAVQENQTDDSCLSDSDLDCYSSHLQALKENLLIRFKDLKELKIPGWVVNPFQADANNADPNLVEELIDLQNDFEGEVRYCFSRLAMKLSGQRNKLNILIFGKK